MFKASWIQSTLYDYRLDWPTIREPNLEIDDQTLILIPMTLCLSVC